MSDLSNELSQIKLGKNTDADLARGVFNKSKPKITPNLQTNGNSIVLGHHSRENVEDSLFPNHRWHQATKINEDLEQEMMLREDYEKENGMSQDEYETDGRIDSGSIFFQTDLDDSVLTESETDEHDSSPSQTPPGYVSRQEQSEILSQSNVGTKDANDNSSQYMQDHAVWASWFEGHEKKPTPKNRVSIEPKQVKAPTSSAIRVQKIEQASARESREKPPRQETNPSPNAEDRYKGLGGSYKFEAERNDGISEQQPGSSTHRNDDRKNDDVENHLRDSSGQNGTRANQYAFYGQDNGAYRGGSSGRRGGFKTERGGRNHQAGPSLQENQESQAHEGPNDRGLRGKKRYIPYRKLETELLSSTYNIEEGPYFDETYNDFECQLTGGDSSSSDTILCEKFEACNFTPQLMKNIQQKGYNRLTPIQKLAIPIILNKRDFDMMAHANTGSGKTAAFLLPIIDIIQKYKASKNLIYPTQNPFAIILSPTRDLAQQHFDEASSFTIGTKVTVAKCYGEIDMMYNKKEIHQGCDIICATSGRLLHFIRDGIVKLDMLQFFVMDEADRLLDDSFIEDIKMLQQTTTKKLHIRTYMFSATYSPLVQTLAKNLLQKHFFFVRIGVLNSAVKNVVQKFFMLEHNEKQTKLRELLRANSIEEENDQGETHIIVPKTMVFVESKVSCKRIAMSLQAMHLNSQALSSGYTQKQREEVLNKFVKGNIDVLVCTNVAARGLNIKGVKHVINFDLPWERDNYVHRIGRTGRLGHTGLATSFIDPNEQRDMSMVTDLVEILNTVGQTPPEFLIEMAEGSRFQSSSCYFRNQREFEDSPFN